MNSISCTYKMERVDTRNFHGYVVFECSEGMEEEIFPVPHTMRYPLSWEISGPNGPIKMLGVQHLNISLDE